MRELIIEVPDNFGKTLKPEKVNVEIKEEIVRCKDCKHRFDGDTISNFCEVLMDKAGWITGITVDPDWFCADGERR